MLTQRKYFYLILLFLLIESAVISTRYTTLAPAFAKRQPHFAFSYGGDIWITELSSQKTLRLTSTAAVESNPHISPDGKWVVFNSNRSGNTAVYIVSIEGGTPKRLTWHPSASLARGWSADGKHVLFATSERNRTDRLRSFMDCIGIDGGPSTLLTKQWGTDGSFSPDGKQIVIDRVDRWDVEWRNYRGGQNTPLVILNLTDQTEKLNTQRIHV
jgi:tricorn protease